ncbi:N-myc-interactor [Pelodytes ibericus]
MKPEQTGVHIIEKLKEEYEELQKIIDDLENQKTALIIKKLDADEKKDSAQRRVMELIKQEQETAGQLLEMGKRFQREYGELNEKNLTLKKKVDELDTNLHKDMKTLRNLQEELQVENKVPETNINYVAPGNATNVGKNGVDLDISYKCIVVINKPFVMKAGETLLTFEQEDVAENVISKKEHKIDFDGTSVDVTAHPIYLKKTIQFEINTTISSKKLCVLSLPSDLPEQHIKDKLELKFYKSNVGGGEINSVEYDKDKNVAVIEFLDHGVVERILKNNYYPFTAGDHTHKVTVQPLYNSQLNKLQIFSAVSPRTVRLSQINGVVESEEDVQDLIEVHFQKPSHGGGEVEVIIYSQKEDKLPCFENDTK